MNKSPNKRWGKKLLLFFCVIISFLCVITIPTIYNKEVKAETTAIDDSPMGEKIIDLYASTMGYSLYGITEQGEVYSWGDNKAGQLGNGLPYQNNDNGDVITPPKKVLNYEGATDGKKYLSNIERIYGGGYVVGQLGYGLGFVYAISKTGEIFVWGDNTYGTLAGLEKGTYEVPRKITLPFNVKSIACGVNHVMFLTTEGEIYALGSDQFTKTKANRGVLGLGKNNTILDEPTKVSTDINGNSIPKVKKVVASMLNSYIMTETGEVYGTGDRIRNGTGTFVSNFVKLIDENQGTELTGVTNLYSEGTESSTVFIHKEDGFYINKIATSNANYVNVVPLSYFDANFKDSERILSQHKDNSREFGAGGFGFISNENKAYFPTGTIWPNKLEEIKPYSEGDITSDYKNAKRLIYNYDYYNVLLTNNGSVYLHGKKLPFGSMDVTITKENGNAYVSEEKYNSSVTLDVITESLTNEHYKFDITDLLTGEKSIGETFIDPIALTTEEGKQIKKKYEFYLVGYDEKIEVIIDLFKQTPTAIDLENNHTYLFEKTINWNDNGITGNTVIGELEKDGVKTQITSGTKIEEQGLYTLVLTDLYGNQNTYKFKIQEHASPESVSFIPTDENGLVYGNTITKAGSVIGTLSLVYADSDVPSTIKTLTIGIDQDGAKFEKSGTNQLKVKGSDLSAGTYVVPISGTDQNDMPFTGEISIVIGKAASTMEWNSDSQKLTTDGLVLGKEVTLGVSNQPKGTTVTYAPKTSNSCITLDSTTGKVKATCVPTPATITFVVTPSGNDNYNLTPLELTVPIKKQSVTITIELLDSDASYKNDVTIKIGDSLPTPRISSTDPTLDLNTLGTPTYIYKKNNVVVPNPSITEGIYTVSASYPSGSLAENYDITWTTATLRVDGITIDENNQSDYFTLTNDGKPYMQGTWTNKDIIITPVHDTFNQIDVNDAGNKNSSAYTYNVEGGKKVKLSFYNSDGAKVSTTVNLNYDHTAPVLTQFNYEEETSLRSMLRAVTFDHFFGKAQQLSFSGSDETGGSGLDHYRYELVELDQDKNEKPASKKTGTLGLDEKLNLNINTSYRISAWAVDVAGNESDEKIERVYLSDEVAQLNITATSGGKAYDGSTWTKSGVSVKLSSTSNAGVEKYQYSSDGVVFHDLSGDTITLPDPISDVDNVTYTFRAIHNDKTEADKTLNLKVDTVKPEFNITGTVNGSPYDGSLVDQNIELIMHQTNTNISGSTLYYTTSPTSKDTDPKTDSNWKRYTAPITHSANGTFTYYFKAISGAGISSDPKEYTVKLTKKEYTNITVNVTSEGKLYSPGNWAKGDVTFTLSGGLKDTTQITGYEYIATNGSKPTASSAWKPATNKTLKLTENVKDQTYWFRAIPIDPDGKTSSGTKVNLDVDAPSIPAMTCEEINTSRIAQLINLFSFGNWMNKQAEVIMSSSDSTSGIDHYEYIEIQNGNETKPKSSNGKVIYGDETELTLKARACDKAGNCSAYTSAEEVKIDMKAPMITGVKDQLEYIQYYLPRFVKVTDLLSGLKEATYKKDNVQVGTFTDHEDTKIKGEGTYEIHAIDNAGNEITLTFKIVELPNINTEIDGSDESRDIIDQIIDELEEVKNNIEPSEKDEYENWIKEAEEKWDSFRKKVIEDEKTTSKVEVQGDATFDPNTKLIVEEISKDKIPVLPRNAIKTYDVYLKKGNTVVQPDGSVKVYLPYAEEEPPIVYEISEDGTYIELPAKQENGYVTFITSTLKKYAISNMAQKENKPNVCVIGPDGKLDSQDDVCGSDNSTKNEDGSVTVPDGGKVIFPDKEIDAPDGAIINPDGSVDFPDGTHFDPDGNEVKKPESKPDDINVDTDNDGKPDINIDINGDGKPDINIDTDGDGVPDINIDTSGDGKPDYNIDTDGDQKADVNVGPLPKPWKPNTCHTINKVGYCTMNGLKPNINIDTNDDGIPDLNVDLNGDGSADLNIDTDFDGIPNIDIDTTGDGKPDLNIDRTGNGKADENIQEVTEWNPTDLVTVKGTTYGIMKSLYREPNIAPEPENPDSTPPTDDGQTKEPQPTPQPSVKGSYQSNVGGAGTSDPTSMMTQWILFTGSLLMLAMMRRKKSNN